MAGSKGARAERTLSERATTMWVRTQEQLAHLAESLSGASALALDTESERLVQEAIDLVRRRAVRRNRKSNALALE